ncbi:hypothetical protein, partial [Pseudomonas helleri]|uniref:hypothetical protein n=1 Tax=Pseudomonas helleri TaxID=1608996 RepID=UPI001E57E3CB
ELTFSKILDSFSSRSDFFYTLKCEEPEISLIPPYINANATTNTRRENNTLAILLIERPAV